MQTASPGGSRATKNCNSAGLVTHVARRPLPRLFRVSHANAGGARNRAISTIAFDNSSLRWLEINT
ncbi:hypothetical protein SAMN05519103_02062 [Rhizobiales bacterium GAS113]|nr:hypothetical protein SAMN05519103_02062 [Rhizobiales bacterium GAS113]